LARLIKRTAPANTRANDKQPGTSTDELDAGEPLASGVGQIRRCPPAQEKVSSSLVGKRYAQAPRPQGNREGENGAQQAGFPDKRFYYDCIIESPQIVTDLIRLVGADRVLFGTDYPSPMRDARPTEFIQNLTEVSPSDREAILGGNAARAFKL
jgi:amidohydrolase family protein